jgi:hypothetical protein
MPLFPRRGFAQRSARQWISAKTPLPPDHLRPLRGGLHGSRPRRPHQPDSLATTLSTVEMRGTSAKWIRQSSPRPRLWLAHLLAGSRPLAHPGSHCVVSYEHMLGRRRRRSVRRSMPSSLSKPPSGWRMHGVISRESRSPRWPCLPCSTHALNVVILIPVQRLRECRLPGPAMIHEIVT